MQGLTLKGSLACGSMVLSFFMYIVFSPYVRKNDIHAMLSQVILPCGQNDLRKGASLVTLSSCHRPGPERT